MELISLSDLAKTKVQTVQDYVLFCLQAVANLFRKPLYFVDMLQQADAIGVGSLPIVVLTGFLTEPCSRCKPPTLSSASGR